MNATLKYSKIPEHDNYVFKFKYDGYLTMIGMIICSSIFYSLIYGAIFLGRNDPVYWFLFPYFINFLISINDNHYYFCSVDEYNERINALTNSSELGMIFKYYEETHSYWVNVNSFLDDNKIETIDNFPVLVKLKLELTTKNDHLLKKYKDENCSIVELDRKIEYISNGQLYNFYYNFYLIDRNNEQFLTKYKFNIHFLLAILCLSMMYRIIVYLINKQKTVIIKKSTIV
jgi:hypothetical protein